MLTSLEKCIFYTSSNLSHKRRDGNQLNNITMSLKILLSILIFSLSIDFISNDKPLIISYDSKLYFPIFKKYPEKQFGGDFLSEANYLDSFIQQKIKEKGWYLMPPLKYHYSTINYNLASPPPTPPSRENILGTDGVARDVFARLIYGLRVSIIFSFILTLISSIIGISLGAISGYSGGLLDLIMQRFIEIWNSLPVLFLLIIFSSLIIPSFWSLLIILIVFSSTTLVAPVRAEFLKARNLEFVKASIAAGVPERNIIFKTILPNAIVSTVTFIPFIFTSGIIALTSLDFLGFGLPAGSASIGELLSQSKNHPSAIWIGLSSFLTLTILLTTIMFAGERIRNKINS